MTTTTFDDCKKHHHVAVFPFPFGNHPSVILSLVRRLANVSPDTKFSFFNTAKSNGSLSSTLKSYSLTNIKTYDVDDGVPEGHVFSGHPQEAVDLFLNAATTDKYKMSVDLAVKETGREVSCLLNDSFLWFVGEMAKEMNVPWVSLWAAAASSLAAHLYTDQLRLKFGVNGIAGIEEETLDFVPCLSKVRVADLPEGVISGNLESPFAQMLLNMARTLPRATTIAINSFEGLEPSVVDHLNPMFTKKLVHIGPLTLTSAQPTNSDPHGCIPWLDKHKPASVVYVSFGSVITPPPHELVALAEAVEASKVPFLWSIKDSMKHHLPNGFEKRIEKVGKLVPWAPQVGILSHASTGVFVTHCGLNSVLESIAGGVPMVCRPFFGDHGLNMRMIESVWEIGIGAEGRVFTKSSTMDAIEKILFNHDGCGEKMRQNITQLKQLSIEAVGPEGSSVKNIRSLLDLA